MFRTTPYLNKQIRKRQEQRNRNYHLEHLKQIRPSTGGIDEVQTHVLNNRKRQQLMENRFTQIERENRILLEKITGIMGHKSKQRKRGSSMFVNPKQSKDNPKSLNVTFRKKQYQEIEIENAKLLRRLQEKKSQYQVDKMKKDWKRQRYVIRNISNYPTMEKKRRDRSSEPGLHQRIQKEAPIHPNIEANKAQKITGHNFIVNVKLDQTKLTIKAVLQGRLSKSEPKIIEIPREQAVEFIAQECNNRIQELFDMLYFDGDTLFLVGQAGEESQENEKQQETDNIPEQSKIPKQEKRSESPIQKDTEIPLRVNTGASLRKTPQKVERLIEREEKEIEAQKDQHQVHHPQHNEEKEEPHPEQYQEDFGESLGEIPIDRKPVQQKPSAEQQAAEEPTEQHRNALKMELLAD